MQRTTRPSGVPESPASSEKGYGESGEKTERAGPAQPLPPAGHPPGPGTHHAPSPLVHNLDQPKVQLSHKLLHCLVQATGHLNLTNPLSHSSDTLYPLQRVRRGQGLQDQGQEGP